MRLILIIIGIWGIPQGVFAGSGADLLKTVKISKKELNDDPDLKAVARKLQSAGMVKMQLKKTVFNVILDEQTTHKGQLTVARGKLRMDIQSPERSSVVVNKNEIWVIQFGADDPQNPTQVVHIRSGKEKVHRLLLSLLDGDQLLENFSIKKSSRKGDLLLFELHPKDPFDEIAKVQLTAHSKNHVVKTIQYWDSTDNKTQFDFSEQQFLDKGDLKIFNFVPPKDVKVEEL